MTTVYGWQVLILTRTTSGGLGPQSHILVVRKGINQHSWALCDELRVILNSREQVGEMVSPINLVMEFNLSFRFLVPSSILINLVIVMILLFIPTPLIISPLLPIMFGLLVTLLVR